MLFILNILLFLIEQHICIESIQLANLHSDTLRDLAPLP